MRLSWRGLGSRAPAVPAYARRPSTRAAFWLGAAMGFGVWGRANFIYLLISGGIAAAIVFRRRILLPVSHVATLVAGGIAGGFPFLLYQVVSGGETWKVQQYFNNASMPMAALLRYRWSLFAETLLSDGEHRKMWDGPPLPDWQLWLFPVVVVLACLVCMLGSGRDHAERTSIARFLALTFIFSAGFLFFSRLQIAEHHLIMLVPLAVAVVVLACSLLQNAASSGMGDLRRSALHLWLLGSLLAGSDRCGA